MDLMLAQSKWFVCLFFSNLTEKVQAHRLRCSMRSSVRARRKPLSLLLQGRCCDDWASLSVNLQGWPTLSLVFWNRCRGWCSFQEFLCLEKAPTSSPWFTCTIWQGDSVLNCCFFVCFLKRKLFLCCFLHNSSNLNSFLFLYPGWFKKSLNLNPSPSTSWLWTTPRTP